MPGRTTIVSLSLQQDLLARFDGWVERKGFASRSAGVQWLLRQQLDAEVEGLGQEPAVATVTFVYDHHARELLDRLTHLQHQHLDLVVSSTHVHLDHDRCMEVLVLRGPARAVRDLAERTLSTRGVERGELVLTPVARRAAGAGHGGRGPAWHAAAHDHDHAHDHAPRPRKKKPRKPVTPRARRAKEDR